jgi:hypothetical protein
MGGIGSGKSSFINTTYSSILRRWQPLNVAKDNAVSVTKKLSKFHVNQSRTISLWDSYGWTETNYHLRAELHPQGSPSRLDGLKEETLRHSVRCFASSPADQVHAVIIVGRGQSVGHPRGRDETGLRFFHEHRTDMGNARRMGDWHFVEMWVETWSMRISADRRHDHGRPAVVETGTWHAMAWISF